MWPLPLGATKKTMLALFSAISKMGAWAGKECHHPSLTPNAVEALQTLQSGFQGLPQPATPTPQVTLWPPNHPSPRQPPSLTGQRPHPGEEARCPTIPTKAQPCQCSDSSSGPDGRHGPERPLPPSPLLWGPPMPLCLCQRAHTGLQAHAASKAILTRRMSTPSTLTSIQGGRHAGKLRLAEL